VSRLCLTFHGTWASTTSGRTPSTATTAASRMPALVIAPAPLGDHDPEVVEHYLRGATAAMKRLMG